MRCAVFAGLDELERAVGERVAESDWLTITQDMVDDFARVTNDRQWIHVDPERAKRESPFGTTIAHGFLTLSLLVPMIQQCVTLPKARLGINYGFDRVRFVAPVPVGAQVRGTFRLHALKRTNDGAQFTWDAEILVQDAPKPSVAALWLGRLIL